MYSNLPLPPINFAGFLAAAPGQARTMQLCEEEKKKKKVSFFPAAYLLRWHGSRNHKSWNIIKTNLQSRFVRRSEGSLSFKPPMSTSLTPSLHSTEEKLSPLSAPQHTKPTLNKTKELRVPTTRTNCCLHLSILSVSHCTGVWGASFRFLGVRFDRTLKNLYVGIKSSLEKKP